MLDYGNYTTVANLYPQDGDNPLSYEHLEGDWGLFYKIARYFVHKVKFEDRDDFRHDLMMEMAKVKAKYEAKGKPLTEAGLMRVASYEVTEYWTKQRKLTSGLDCGHCSTQQRRKCREDDLYSQCPKLIKLVSLNGEVDNGDGDRTELYQMLADDKAIDLEAWTDARTWLLGCPKRLVAIAYKRVSGVALDGKDKEYLRRFRQREQERLF